VLFILKRTYSIGSGLQKHEIIVLSDEILQLISQKIIRQTFVNTPERTIVLVA
jgi:hypothetical protein